MTSTSNLRPDVAKVLRELVYLDYDAIEAYEAAIDRLDNPEFRAQLTAFCEDHRRHTNNLASHIHEIGAEIPEGPDFKRILIEGKVIIAGLAGDKAILAAMRANEHATNKAYEKALEHVDPTEKLHATLHANLMDERKHLDWIEKAHDSLK